MFTSSPKNMVVLFWNTAIFYLKQHFHLLLTRCVDKLDQVKAEIEKIGQKVIPVGCDFTKEEIVNIASVNAVMADMEDFFMRHSYNASKSAVLGLTKGMSCSYAKYGITVNVIGPALFETEMTAEGLFKSEQFMNLYKQKNPSGRPGKKGE